AGRNVGQGLAVAARQEPRSEDPALEDEVRVRAGEVTQRFRGRHRVAAVAADEGDGDGSLEARDDVVEAGVVRGPPGESVLEDLVVGGRGAQRGPQGGDVTDGETPILG